MLQFCGIVGFSNVPTSSPSQPCPPYVQRDPVIFGGHIAAGMLDLGPAFLEDGVYIGVVKKECAVLGNWKWKKKSVSIGGWDAGVGLYPCHCNTGLYLLH